VNVNRFDNGGWRLNGLSQSAVVKRYGGRRGDLKKAMIDAIEKWLKEEARD